MPRSTAETGTPPAASARPSLTAGLLLGDALVLAGVAVGLALLGRRVPVPLAARVLLGALLAACAAGVVGAARAGQPLRLIVATALCIPLLDAGGRSLLAREIGAVASTRELAASVQRVQRGGRCELAFFRDVPFSARFYLGEAGLALEGDPARLPSLASDPACRLLAVRRLDLRDLDRDALRGLHPVRDFGGYVLFGNAAAG